MQVALEKLDKLWSCCIDFKLVFGKKISKNLLAQVPMLAMDPVARLV